MGTIDYLSDSNPVSIASAPVSEAVELVFTGLDRGLENGVEQGCFSGIEISAGLRLQQPQDVDELLRAHEIRLVRRFRRIAQFAQQDQGTITRSSLVP